MHLEVLVQVNPSAVGAWFVLETIDKDPLLRIGDESDGGLALGKQFVIDFNVAVRCSADDDSLSCQILLVVVYLSCRGSAEYLELKLDRGIIRVDVDIGRDVYLLRCH